MKKKLLSVLALVLAALLSGCGKREAPDAATDTETRPYEEYNTAVPSREEDASSEDTNPAESGMVRSPLTNEWISPEAAARRPIAVLVANEAAALPQYSLSEASVLYEANVEGRMTRLMAIYDDWADLEKIGNVRSLRTYYAYWAFEWDALLVHCGGPYYVNTLLAEDTTQHIDETLGSDSKAFFRASNRQSPHNVYTSGTGIQQMMEQKGYEASDRGLTDGAHFLFAPDDAPNTLTQYEDAAENAVYIDMTGAYPLTRCYFEYNETDHLYYRSQYLSSDSDRPHTDAEGDQLSFRNILVQNVYYEDIGDGYLVFMCHDTTRDGWFFTEGKGIHVTWKKTADYSATRFYDDDGNEILLNTGKTMICVVEEGDTFSFR